MSMNLRHLNKDDNTNFKIFRRLLDDYEKQSGKEQISTAFDICEAVISEMIPLIFNLDDKADELLVEGNEKANQLFVAGNEVIATNRALNITNGKLSKQIFELKEEMKELRGLKKRRPTVSR